MKYAGHPVIEKMEWRKKNFARNSKKVFQLVLTREGARQLMDLLDNSGSSYCTLNQEIVGGIKKEIKPRTLQ